MQREPNTEYILSLSYGKDSLACLEAIKQLGYPLDRIVHAEVWATDTIPADLPPMIDFKAHADKIIKEKYGYTVEHICAVRGVRNLPTTPNSTSGLTKDETKTESMVSLTPSERGVTADSKLMSCSQSQEKITYEKLFYHIPKRRKKPQTAGGEKFTASSPNGFPVQQVPWCNSGLKKPVFRQINSRIPNPKRNLVQQQPQNCCHTGFQSQSAEGIGVPNSNSGFSGSPIAQGAKKNIVQYLGIAADEPERIKRHSVPGKMLPLVDIGWDEAYCRQWCEENDLLSPIYTTATRGGCWFCHNQGVDQLRLLRKNYPDLWRLLLKWDKDSPTTFKSDGHTVHDFEKRFEAEDKGIVKAGDKKFRWKQVLQDEKKEVDK